jgi:hypothetical protein
MSTSGNGNTTEQLQSPGITVTMVPTGTMAAMEAKYEDDFGDISPLTSSPDSAPIRRNTTLNREDPITSSDVRRQPRTNNSSLPSDLRQILQKILDKPTEQVKQSNIRLQSFPIYSGTPKENLSAFIYQFERTAEIEKIMSDHDKTQIMLTRLREFAAAWAMGQPQPFTTFKELRFALEAKYGSNQEQRTIFDLDRQLFAIDEEIDSHIEQFEKIAARIPDLQPQAELISFTNSLSHLKNAVLMHKPTTLADAKDLARLAFQNHKMTEKVVTIADRKRERKDTYHQYLLEQKDVMSKLQQQVTDLQTQLHENKKPRYSSSSPSQYSSSSTRPSSFRSSRNRNQSLPFKQCAYCGMSGHLMRDCRQYIYENTPRNNNYSTPAYKAAVPLSGQDRRTPYVPNQDKRPPYISGQDKRPPYQARTITVRKNTDPLSIENIIPSDPDSDNSQPELL